MSGTSIIAQIFVPLFRIQFDYRRHIFIVLLRTSKSPHTHVHGLCFDLPRTSPHTKVHGLFCILANS